MAVAVVHDQEETIEAATLLNSVKGKAIPMILLVGSYHA